MSKGNTFENDLLKLIFNGTAIANLADNAATAALTSLYVSLHTADPGEGGDQTTNEAAYTGYSRTPVNRTGGAFIVTGNSVSPAGTISFSAATGGNETELFFAIGTAATGTGKILYSGVIGSRAGAFTAKASTDTLTIPGASFSVGDRIAFQPVDGFSLPTGLTAGTVYWVKTVSGSDVTISATSGGSAVDLTGDGAGYAFKDAGIAVSAGVTPQLSTATTITED